MSRALFLVSERTGSTFLTAILIGHPGTCDNKFGGLSYEKPFWLHTLPPKKGRFFYGGISTPVPSRLESQLSNCLDAYMWTPPASCAPSFYNSLPGSWKFIYLLRDPRNRICSLAKRARLQGEKRKDLLRTLCRHACNEAESVSLIRDNSQFFLLSFEELMNNPLSTLKLIFRHLDLELDEAFYSHLIAIQTANYVNTSFQDKGKKRDERWKSLPKDELNILNEMLPLAIKTLGYKE